jgi:hypothetical protein
MNMFVRQTSPFGSTDCSVSRLVTVAAIREAMQQVASGARAREPDTPADSALPCYQTCFRSLTVLRHIEWHTINKVHKELRAIVSATPPQSPPSNET